MKEYGETASNLDLTLRFSGKDVFLRTLTEALPVVVTYENVSIACRTVHRMIPGARILESQ